MGKPATLAIKITGDSTSAQRALQSVDKSTSSMARGMKTAMAGLAVYFTGSVVLGFAKDAVSAAAEVEQSMGALDSVFKDSSAEMKRWAASAAESVGLSESEYGSLATTLGAQLKNMGTSSDELGTKTNDLIGLGSDLAAMFGGTTADAVGALSSLLRGERDPIERYGVAMNQASIDAKVAALGLDTSTAAAKKNAEAQATLAILAEQTADAEGQFARETSSAAGAQQIANAQWENAKALIGEQLLPAYTALMGFLSSTVIPGIVALVNGAAQLASWVQRNAVIIGVWAAAIGVAVVALNAQNIVIGVYLGLCKAARIATTAWAVAQRILNLAMKANPIGIVITIVMLLVAAIITAYQRSETFHRIVQGVWSAVKTGVTAAVNAVIAVFKKVGEVAKTVWSAIKSAVMGPIDAITGAFDALVDAIKSVISWFGKVKVPDWLSNIGDWVGSLGGLLDFSAAAPSAARSFALSGAPSTFGALARAGAVPVSISTADLASLTQPAVRVYIGDQELRGLVRVEIGRENTALARRITARPGVAS